MDLSEIRRHYISEGYSALNASAKTCQDVILAKIAASPLKESVTVKGGVLMCAISGSKRRATQDIDLDFVRYPISDEAIRSFIRTLSAVDDGISMDIVGGIEELSQQDYKGKRVRIKMSDGRTSLESKLDLGVNASLSMEQDECWFDIAQSDEGICLLGNSKEQIFVEKLISLLRHGIRSTRFRDLYDMYYIGNAASLDQSRLKRYIEGEIIDNPDMWDDSMEGIATRVGRTLSNRQFIARMKTSHRDWIGKSAEEVARWLPSFLRRL